MSLNLLSGLAFGGLVACLAMLLRTQAFFADTTLTIAIQIAAAALMLWARLTLRMRSFHATASPTKGGLITNGPYRWVRHPIYASIIYFIAGSALAHFSLMNLSLCALAITMLVIRMLAEEAALRGTYPEYSHYAARTARVIPFIV